MRLHPYQPTKQPMSSNMAIFVKIVANAVVHGKLLAGLEAGQYQVAVAGAGTTLG